MNDSLRRSHYKPIYFHLNLLSKFIKLHKLIHLFSGKRSTPRICAFTSYVQFFLVIASIFAWVNPSHAQPCAHPNHQAFVIQVEGQDKIDSGSLRLSLLDEKFRPLYYLEIEGPPMVGKHVDLPPFHQNVKNKREKNPLRKYYSAFGDHHVLILDVRNFINNDPSASASGQTTFRKPAAFFVQATFAVNGRERSNFLYYPKDRTINLCANRLLAAKNLGQKELIDNSGETFKAPVFDIFKEFQPEPSSDPKDALLICSYHVRPSNAGRDSAVALTKIAVHDRAHFTPIQEISIPDPELEYVRMDKMDDYLVMSKACDGFPPITFLGDEYRDEFGILNRRWEHYFWSAEQRKYLRNDALSDFPNVEFRSDGEPTRHEFFEKPGSQGMIFRRDYSLSNGEWIALSEAFFRNERPEFIPQSVVRIPHESRYTLPLLVLDSTLEYSSWSKRLFLCTQCEDKAISLVSMGGNAFLQLQHRNDSTFILLKDSVWSDLTPMETREFAFQIVEPGFMTRTVRMDYTFIPHSNGWARESGEYVDRLTIEDIARKLIFNPETLMPIASGLFDLHSGKRLGTWMSWNKNQGGFVREKHNTAVQLYLSTEGCSPESRLRCDGEWKPFKNYSDQEGFFHFYIDGTCDSVRFACSDQKAWYRFNEKHLLNEKVSVQLYMIQDGEDHLESGGIAIPVHFRDNVHAILWNYNSEPIRKELSEKGLEGIIAELSAKYETLNFGFEPQLGVWTLEAKSGMMSSNILKKLQAERYIDALCTLHDTPGNGPEYFTGRIYLRFVTAAQKADFEGQISRYPLKRAHGSQHEANYPYYSYRYSPMLVGKQMLQTLNQLKRDF